MNQQHSSIYSQIFEEAPWCWRYNILEHKPTTFYDFTDVLIDTGTSLTERAAKRSAKRAIKKHK